MKKIISLLFVLLVVLFSIGCEKKEKHEDDVKEVKIKEKYNYYASTITYVNHDDYDDNVLNTEKEVANISFKEDTKKDSGLSEKVEIENNDVIIKDKEEEKVNSHSTINDETKKDKTIDDTREEETKVNSVKNDEEITDLDSKKDNGETNNNQLLKEEGIVETKPVQNEPGYYSPSGMYLGEKNIKVIDVSYYQGMINWDKFASESDCYGVILRLGYYKTLDKMFERNISELKRLSIPYGIYLFSYSTTLNGAKIESDFTNEMIDKYNLEPTLGIYYDIESWKTKNDSSDNITKTRYDEIIQLYVNNVSSHVLYKYKVKVYSGRWYAMNRLGFIAKSYVDWVAEYNSTCKYDGTYFMWQYTSKGKVPGIEGNVDISYIMSQKK